MTASDDIENDVVALTCALRETRRHWRFDETGVPYLTTEELGRSTQADQELMREIDGRLARVLKFALSTTVALKLVPRYPDTDPFRSDFEEGWNMSLKWLEDMILEGSR